MALSTPLSALGAETCCNVRRAADLKLKPHTHGSPGFATSFLTQLRQQDNGNVICIPDCVLRIDFKLKMAFLCVKIFDLLLHFQQLSRLSIWHQSTNKHIKYLVHNIEKAFSAEGYNPALLKYLSSPSLPTVHTKLFR